MRKYWQGHKKQGETIPWEVRDVQEDLNEDGKRTLLTNKTGDLDWNIRKKKKMMITMMMMMTIKSMWWTSLTSDLLQ